MKTMQAARWHAAKDIRIEEIPVPQPKKGQVKIAVQFAGICGSDLHEYNHGPKLIPLNAPYPLNGHQGVTTLGHEFSGIIEEVGEGVTHLKKGDRVVVEPMYKNFDSPFTKAGAYNLGEHLGFIGLTGDGGFANYVVVEDYMVHLMPESMTFEQGAMVEPAAVAVYAVMNSGLQLGETIFISGAGPIGLLCTQAALAAGASTVIVTDIAEKRLEKAKEIGATHVFNAMDQDLHQKIKLLTDQLGPHVFLDCAGVQASYDAGFNAVRNGGTVILVAQFAQPLQHDALQQVIREITVKGVTAYRNIFPQTMKLINSGQMPVEKLITNKISLDEIVDKGFEALIKNPSQVKILIDIAQ